MRHITTVVLAASPLVAYGTVTVDGFDSDAIAAAMAQATAGEEIVFPPGVYDVTQAIWPKLGQILTGLPGTVLRRADAVTTTLTAAALAGTREITLAEPYPVGTYISLPAPDGSITESSRHFIVSVIGNVATLNNDLASSYEAGRLVTNVFRMIETINPLTVRGFTFDGNRANQVVTDWRRNRHVQGHEGLIVQDNIFYEMSSTAVDAYGGDSLIEHNTFFGTDSAGIHCSNDLIEDGDTIIRNNRFIETNQRAEIAGHSEGALTISLRCEHMRVLDNIFQDIPEHAIGSFHIDMYDWTVAGNTALFTDGLTESKQNNNGPAPLSDIAITKNRVYHSAQYTRMNTLHAIVGLSITDNQFVDSDVKIEDASGWLDGNVFACSALEEVGPNYLDHGSNAHTTNCGPYYLPGDTNLDGAVDLADLHVWNENRGRWPATWLDADFNGDRLVDVADFDIWRDNLFANIPTTAPEPAGWWLLAVAAVVIGWRRWSMVGGKEAREL